MTGNSRQERRWTIGELAQACGLTVRTLHHYDEIGLLSASERTRSGHRRYTEADLRRLYRVRALRGLGLSLDEVRTTLDENSDDLAALAGLLTAQLRELEVSAGRIAALRTQIGELLREIGSPAGPDPQQIMTTLEMIKTQWLDLAERLRRHQQEGTPPEAAPVQTLVRRWDELAERFHGGDEQIKAAAARMWAENRAEISARMDWSADRTDDLLAYLARARQAGGGVSSRLR
ncbi:MAG TPA: MerR family transcriptional regulator [Pseudonocardiaceae bacterium]